MFLYTLSNMNVIFIYFHFQNKMLYWQAYIQGLTPVK